MARVYSGRRLMLISGHTTGNPMHRRDTYGLWHSSRALALPSFLTTHPGRLRVSMNKRSLQGVL
ncbi:hypothetical protein LZ31DRAFT_550262 [Colletotrichum somersetense]|nr:hypothetical protein LZ31DRAFT_550262 [Colletotrichum somersetense]